MIEHVITIVSGRDTVLATDIINEIANHLHSAGYAPRLDWLAADRAVDLFVEAPDAEKLHGEIGHLLHQQPVDLIVQAVKSRRKKLLAADMESTIIEQEMLDELAAAIGVGERVADITRRAMNGELDFIAALKERVALLAGQPESLLEEVGRRVTFMPGARELVATMRAHDAICWLVTGGFGGFASPVAHELGFTEAYANHLFVQDGVIVGKVLEPILDRNMKKAMLERACQENGLSLADSVAVGDGANDVPMLQAAHEGGGLGIAFHAKPNVRAVIPNQINYGDLTSLLYVQGYRLHEITTKVG